MSTQGKVKSSMTSIYRTRFFAAIFFILTCLPLWAQPVWTNRFNSIYDATDLATHIATDNVGFVYVAGNSFSTNSGHDLVVIKYEPDGTPSETWPDQGDGPGFRRFSKTLDDKLFGLSVDPQGNVYLAGNSWTTDAVPTSQVVKYDSQGNRVWTAQAIASSDGCASMQIDGQGNVYLLHNYVVWTHAGGGATLYKFTPQGLPSPTWPNNGYGVGVRRYTNSLARVFNVSSDGRVTVTGASSNQEVFAAPSLMVHTWRYSTNGQLLWSSLYASSDFPYDYPTAIKSDALGNVFIAGTTATNVSAGKDYLLLKYRSDGQPSETWADTGFGVGVRKYDRQGATNEIPAALELDSQGNAVISGFSYRTNGLDLVTMKFDPAGNLSTNWPRVNLPTNWPSIWNSDAGVRVTNNISGSLTNITMKIDALGNVLLTYRASAIDEFRLLEYATNGVRKSLFGFNGPLSGSDEPRGLALDPLGNAFVTGVANSYGSGSDFLTIGYYRNGAPVADAGPDQNVAADGNCQAIVTLNGTGSSDPDTNTLAYVWTGSFGSITGATAVVTLEKGTHVATLTVTDKYKVAVSDTVSITISDQTAPTFTVPLVYTVDANAAGMGAVPSVLSDVVAADNCTAANLLNKLQSPFSGTAVPVGTHEITVSVSDPSGNIATKTVTLNVRDVTSPVISGLVAITNAANAEGVAGVPDFAATATITDAVTASGALTVTQSPLSGTLRGVGEHLVTVTATDAAGNSASATVTFTVVDATAPTISSLTSLTVSAGANGLGIVPNASGAVAVADNVTPTAALIISQSPAAGSAIGLGNHIITVTVTDAAGNSASTTVSLRVVDTTAPVISSLTASPSTLSPANGKLLPVTLTAVVADNTDATPTTRIVSVTSNETIVVPGGKNPDYEITGTMTLNLRAKSSTSAGRIYYVTVNSTDDAGNVAQSTVQIKVATTSGGGGGGKNK